MNDTHRQKTRPTVVVGRFIRRSNARSRAAAAAALLALSSAAALAACAKGTEPTTPGGPDATASVAFADGLVQTVTLSPQPVATGGILTIRSVIANRGAAPVTLERRACGLDLGGTLVVAYPPTTMRCAAYSMTSALAPGDSAVAIEYKQVVSHAGLYELRVQHALHPSAVVTLPVQVDAP